MDEHISLSPLLKCKHGLIYIRDLNQKLNFVLLPKIESNDKRLLTFVYFLLGDLTDFMSSFITDEVIH